MAHLEEETYQLNIREIALMFVGYKNEDVQFYSIYKYARILILFNTKDNIAKFLSRRHI